uniref:Thioredoxin domain-containing protein n=1 Tax=viral metagenome TaxID=1070528 RepID=A0A6C0LWF1_9ZZZZ
MTDNKYGHKNSKVYECMAKHFTSRFDSKNNEKIFITAPQFKDKYGIVKFYAPWCGHCSDMVDSLEYLANELPNMGKPFYIAAVNCTNKSVGNDLLASKMGIRGFPTLFFANLEGELESFNPQSRSIEGILAEICDCTKKYNSNNTCCSYSNNKLECN